MKPDILYEKLREAYTEKNLNRITARLIHIYKQKDHQLIREIATRVPSLKNEIREKDQKCFSRLVVLYHPDKAGRIQQELKLLYEKGDQDGLEQYAHILQMDDLEQLESTRIDPDIGYDPEYIWDTQNYNYSGFSEESGNMPDDTSYGAYREGSENWDPESWDSPPGHGDAWEHDPAGGMSSYPNEAGQADFERSVYNLIKMREYGDLNMEFPAYYLEDFEEFELSYSGLTSLDGIQHCKHARILDLRSNQLEHLDLLRTLSFIEELFLSENRLSSIDPLAQLKWLRKLDLSGNQVDDLEALMHLEHLEYLNLLGNPVHAWQIDELKEKGVLVIS